MEKQIFAILFIFSTVFCLPELDYINTLRAKHNSPPLQYNTTLAKNSNQWAYHLSSTTSLVHSSGFVGENLGLTQLNSNATMSIIDMWYNENIFYDYSNPKFTYETGHFTQIVWKNTKTVGFGISIDAKTNFMYMVMQFYPPGNVQGEFKENVQPTLEDILPPSFVVEDNSPPPPVVNKSKMVDFTCKCKC